MEYLAQCWGGPVHGEPISALVEEWSYREQRMMWLDGKGQEPSVARIEGKYRYAFKEGLDGGAGAHVWEWDGPGADGDTIERLRK